jgi:hypothetical protein
MSVISDERAELYRWLEQDFGSAADAVMELCCDEASGRPLYFSHVRLAAGSTGGALPDSVFSSISKAYIYLTASYYVADSIIDGHPCHRSNLAVGDLALFLQALTAAALGIFLECAEAEGGTIAMHIRQLFNDTLKENRIALGAERESRISATVDWEREALHMWGRSNSFLFLVDCLAVVRSYRMPPPFRLLIQRLLIAIQRGDDVCDWREDLATESWTPFLRETMGGNAFHPPTLEALEEDLYVDGKIEAELLIIDEQLRLLETEFRQYEFGEALSNLASIHRERVMAKYNLFSEVRRSVQAESYECANSLR